MQLGSSPHDHLRVPGPDAGDTPESGCDHLFRRDGDRPELHAEPDALPWAGLDKTGETREWYCRSEAVGDDDAAAVG
ncbi:hypothetical protein, partial [Glycomyces tenuis]|uniref:hypothetical protein n=1 Tax=Glycomyces tenuis TaxID=58116 RepID=UPI001B800910